MVWQRSLLCFDPAADRMTRFALQCCTRQRCLVRSAATSSRSFTASTCSQGHNSFRNVRGCARPWFRRYSYEESSPVRPQLTVVWPLGVTDTRCFVHPQVQCQNSATSFERGSYFRNVLTQHRHSVHMLGPL